MPFAKTIQRTTSLFDLMKQEMEAERVYSKRMYIQLGKILDVLDKSMVTWVLEERNESSKILRQIHNIIVEKDDVDKT